MMVEMIMDNQTEVSVVYDNVCKEVYTGDKAVLLQLCLGIQTDVVGYTVRLMIETAESLGKLYPASLTNSYQSESKFSSFSP